MAREITVRELISVITAADGNFRVYVKEETKEDELTINYIDIYSRTGEKRVVLTVGE